MLLLALSCANCTLLFPLDGIGNGKDADVFALDAKTIDGVGAARNPDGSVDARALDSTDNDGARVAEAGSDGPTNDGADGAAANGDAADGSHDAADGDSAGVVDASPEGATNNGEGAADAPALGTDAADTGVVFFCSSLSPQPRFCDDFDQHALPGFWSTYSQVGGVLGLDTSAFVSPPNSLLAQDSPLQPGQPLDTALRTRFMLSAPPTTIVWDFQTRPVVVDTTTGATTVVAAIDFIDVSNNRYSVQFTLAPQSGALRLRLEEQSGFVDGGSSYAAHQLPDLLSIGAWTHVRLVFTRTAPMTASARVTFGTTTELDTPMAMTNGGTTLQMAVGSTYTTEPSQGWKIRYDNVTLDY